MRDLARRCVGYALESDKSPAVWSPQSCEGTMAQTSEDDARAVGRRVLQRWKHK